MKIIPHPQGTPGWHAARAWPAHPASEAAIAMGLSPYKSRTDLLREKATGDVPEVDAATQARFDQGHATEAAARAILEAELGDDLYPVTATDDAGYLLASSDGVNMTGDIGFEHKLWSEERAAAVRAGELLPQDWPQAEQNIRVFGLDKLIFVVSDGTKEKRELLEYKAVPGRIEKVMAAWAQFDADLASYQHVEVIPAAVAAPVMALPALSIQVNGSISLIDNLAVFGEKLTEFIGNVNREPKDDQGFADLDAAVKTLQTAQDALEAAESNALAQTTSIDEMRRTVAMYRDMARSNRLLFGKIVEEKKKSIRYEIQQDGVMALAAHIDGLNKRIGAVKPYMPAVPADFAGVMKGKKTIASLRSAVADELARAKIAANSIADGIQVNLNTLRELAKDHAFLFADAPAIVLKANDDFAILVKSRIDAHKVSEEKKIEAVRETLRIEAAENLAKQQREEAAKLVAAEAQRQADAVKAAQVAPAPLLAPAIVPATAQPAPIEQPAAWGLPPRTATIQTLPGRTKPSGPELVEAVALHFHVSAATAADWLMNTPADEYAGWPKSA